MCDTEVYRPSPRKRIYIMSYDAVQGGKKAKSKSYKDKGGTKVNRVERCLQVGRRRLNSGAAVKHGVCEHLDMDSERC